MVQRRTGVDPTERRIREFCLALSGTEEVEAWGHPNFKAAGKAFAALERIKSRPSLALRVAFVDPTCSPPTNASSPRRMAAANGSASGWIAGRPGA